MKVLVVGPAQSGKDEVSLWLDRHTALKFGGSTSKYICPSIAPKLGMTEDEAYKCRHRYRQMWKEEGDRLRGNDPGYLVRTALAHGEVVAGLRDYSELEFVSQHRLVDWVLWIDRPGFTEDSTLEFTIDDCVEMFAPAYRHHQDPRPIFDVIPNTGNLVRLYSKVKAWCRAANVPYESS